MRFLVSSLLLLAVAAGLPVLADEATAASPADTADTDDDAAADSGSKREVVRVEASSPYIPSSNTIATRLPVSLLDTPSNVGTVNEPVIRDQFGLILGHTLRNVSSVNAQTQSGVADYFLIRGYDSLSSGLVLTDGAAEPEVTFFQTYNVERVEVLKGPGGFLYGRNGLAGALAGAVNIVRRQPVPADFTRVGLSGGSFNTYQGTVDWNHANKEQSFGLRVNAMYRESDAFRQDKENRTWGFNPAFTWWLDADSAINLNIEYVQAEHQPDSGIPVLNGQILPVGRTNSYQSDRDFSEQDVGRVQLDYQTKLSGSWDLRNKTYYRSLDWQSNGTLINGVFPNFFTGQPEVSRTLTLLDDQQNYVGNQLEGVFHHASGKVEHNLLVGFELSSYFDEFTIDQGCDEAVLAFTGQCVFSNVDPAQPMDPDIALTTQTLDSGDTQTLVAAPYAIYQVQLNPRFQVLAGARLDVIDFEDKVSGAERRDTDVSPMLGLVFSPAEDQSLYANASQSYAPPSNRVDDPEPEPEEGTQYELGYKVDHLDGKLQTTVAVYQLERENIPVPDSNGFTQQVGDQRSRGVELDVAVEPIPGLRTLFSYSYTESEFTSFTETALVGVDVFFQPIFGAVDRTGNAPAFVPEHLANLWVTQRFDSGFGYGVGGRYVGEQFIAADNAFELEEYVLVDAAVYFSIGRYDFQINGKNLTEEDYFTRGFYDARTGGEGAVIPGPGRTFFATVDIRF